MEANKKNLIADIEGLFEFSATWNRNGEPVDLSGWESGSLDIVTRSDEPQLVYSSPCEMDDQGNIATQIEPEDLPEPGAYAWRLSLVENPGDSPRFLLVGRFTVRTPADV